VALDDEKDKARMETKKVTCVLCDKKAITCSAQIPTCAEHSGQYEQEAARYLPLSQRPFYQRLIRAYEQTGKQYFVR
jgi:hypothetical protein